MADAPTAAATGTVAWEPERSELPGSALLAAPLDASPALIYVKDREGRYLRINRRLAECLGTTAERLLGHTDAELPTGETIDGPRLEEGSASGPEPRQLEYIVAPFGVRPALSVLRFTLFDDAGEPIGTCGVAAPVGDSALARTECERLLGLAGMTPAAPVLPVPPAVPVVPVVATGEAAAATHEPRRPVDAALGADRPDPEAVRLATALEHERERAERAESALAAERQRAQQAEVALAGEREREQAASDALARERVRSEQAEEAHRSAMAELSEQLAVLQREGVGAVDSTAMAAAEAERVRAEQEAVRLATALEHELRRAERAEAGLAAERQRAQQAEVALAGEREREQAASEALAAEREGQHTTTVALESERTRVAELTERLTVLQRDDTGAVDARAMAAVEAERVRAEQEAVRLATAAAHEHERAERAELALADERERVQRAETTLALTDERHRAADAAVAQERQMAQLAEEARRVAEAELAATRRDAEAAARRQAEEVGQREELAAALRAANARAEALAASPVREPPAPSPLPEPPAPEPSSDENGAAGRLRWGPIAQRSLAVAIARSADWDATLREATKAVGVAGGWHAAFAWTPDLRSKRLRCAASWIDPEAELGPFETATRQQMVTFGDTRLGAAIQSGQLRWSDEETGGSERRWAAVQREGMQAALFVPLRADGPPAAVLELLSREPRPAGAALDAVYEAIAVELGHLCQLFRLGSEPRWGIGRV